MNAAYEVRYGVLLALLYLLLAVGVLAVVAVSGSQENVREAERISRGYGLAR